MFRSMKEIVELLDEADEARLLSIDIRDPVSLQDLLAYAAALEAEAGRLDSLGNAERGVPSGYPTNSKRLMLGVL